MNFSQEEIDRYNRQMMMDRLGMETQEKIKDSTVFMQEQVNVVLLYQYTLPLLVWEIYVYATMTHRKCLKK